MYTDHVNRGWCFWAKGSRLHQLMSINLCFRRVAEVASWNSTVMTRQAWRSRPQHPNNPNNPRCNSNSPTTSEPLRGQEEKVPSDAVARAENNLLHLVSEVGPTTVLVLSLVFMAIVCAFSARFQTNHACIMLFFHSGTKSKTLITLHLSCEVLSDFEHRFLRAWFGTGAHCFGLRMGSSWPEGSLHILGKFRSG